MDIFVIQFLHCKRTRSYRIMIMFNCVTFSRRLHADDITRSFNYIIFRQYCHVQICLTYRRLNGSRKITDNLVVDLSWENVCLDLHTMRTRHLFCYKLLFLWLKLFISRRLTFAREHCYDKVMSRWLPVGEFSQACFAGSTWSACRRQFAFTIGGKAWCGTSIYSPRLSKIYCSGKVL